MTVYLIEECRKDFPSLERRRKDKPPVYFDNACTTLVPRQVVDLNENTFAEFIGSEDKGLKKKAKELLVLLNDGVTKYKAQKNSSKLFFSKKDPWYECKENHSMSGT